MDDLDQAILEHLRRDGRAGYSAMARDMGTSEGTIRARVKRLCEDGTILGFTVRTQGADVRALIELQAASNTDVESIARRITAWREVEAVWEVTGDLDLMVMAHLETPQHLNDLIDRIRGIDGVTGTRSRLVLREYSHWLTT